MKIFINASNVTASGPRRVLENLLPALVRAAPEFKFVAFLPQTYQCECPMQMDGLQLIFPRSGMPGPVRRIWETMVEVSHLCRRERADICLTLGDIGPFRLDIPHVVMLHRLHCLYPGRELKTILPGASWQEVLRASYCSWHFRRMARHCRFIIVQTPIVARRLKEVCDIKSEQIATIPSTIAESTRNALRGKVPADSEVLSVPQPVRLLYLADMRAHKGHAVLPSVCKELQKRGLDQSIHFFLTIDEQREELSRRLMKDLRPYRNFVTNLGSVPHHRVPSLLAASSALFLPTNMETFGLPFAEAMAARIPVLTSDREFARWICGETAIYFEPADPISVANAISGFVETGFVENYAICAGKQLQRLPSSWDDIAVEFLGVAAKCL